jgi:hypothetical protein
MPQWKYTSRITKPHVSWKDKYENLQMFNKSSPQEETDIYELIEREISYIFSAEASIQNNPTTYRFVSPNVNRVLLLYITYPSFLLEDISHSRVSHLQRYTDYIDYVMTIMRYENTSNLDLDRYRSSITQDLALAKKRIRHCNKLIKSYYKDYNLFLHLVLFRYCTLFDMRNNIISFLLP